MEILTVEGMTGDTPENKGKRKRSGVGEVEKPLKKSRGLEFVVDWGRQVVFDWKEFKIRVWRLRDVQYQC